MSRIAGLVLLSLAVPSLLTAQEQGASSSGDESWRFVVLADWHSAEKYIMRDRDKDGLLTLEELLGDPTGRNVPSLTRQFKARDRNGDGRLSEDEVGR